MGFLGYFDLNKFCKHCSYFIETGLGGGAGLLRAKQYPFKKLYSMEVVDEIFEAGKAALEPLDNRIEILYGSSVEILPRILKDIPENEGIVFWLDAHFPGADYGMGTHHDPHPDQIKYPLVEELKIITTMRPSHRDVIICDDLRIYKKGKYDNGNLPSFADSRYDVLTYPSGYNVEEHFAHEGYLILIGDNIGTN